MKAEKGEEAEEEKRRSVNAIADTTQYVHNAMLLDLKFLLTWADFFLAAVLCAFTEVIVAVVGPSLSLFAKSKGHWIYTLTLLMSHVQINPRHWFLKPWWSGLGASRRNWRQVCETGTCSRTSEVWPNGFASRLVNSRKWLKAVTYFTYMRMTCDELVSTYVGWPNDKNLRRQQDKKSTLVMQVHSSSWQNEFAVWPGLKRFVHFAFFFY